MPKRKPVQPFKPKPTGGRPFAVTLDMPIAGQQNQTVRKLLEALGAMQCRTTEVAAALAISEPTLFAFFKREPEARELYHQGKEMGKISLRRTQFRLAERSAPMAIFLGMNILGQRDRRDADVSGTVNHAHTFMGMLMKDIDQGRQPVTVEHQPQAVEPE